MWLQRLVLQNPDFAKYVFHRVVDIGRCPKCCFLRYKCMSATSGTTERAEWQRLAAAHQSLQLQQKQVRGGFLDRHDARIGEGGHVGWGIVVGR